MKPDNAMNVCAIRRKSDGRFYQENNEHGAGWTDRIRQSWTKREADIVARTLFERGWTNAGDVEVVELEPSNQKGGAA